MRRHQRVLALQHSQHEHLGLIGDALTRLGIEFEHRRLDLGHEVPKNLGGYHGLVILGGPQAAYDGLVHPFLTPEKDLVHGALEMGRPVLGICLGSQILAECLGSSVRSGDTFEVGWRDVFRDPAAARDPVLAALPEVFTPLHWHGDVFDLPPDTVSLGASDATAVQGFVWREHAYGFLFHLEMTRAQVERMAIEFPRDLARGGLSAADLLRESGPRLDTARALALEVFARWAALL